MLSAEQLEKFHRDGFLKGASVLSDAEVAVLQEETLRVIADQGDSTKPQPVMCHKFGSEDRPIWQIVNIWEASPPFKDLVMKSQIAEEIAQLTGDQTIRLWHDQIQYKPAGVGGVNHWHQDGPYWPILTPKSQVTAWVALDDVDEENGCMRMVPGSHLWGDHVKFLESLPNFDAMPASYLDHPLTVHSCPVKKGEVHYHHALTWHGSGPNLSGRPRRAIALHYMTEDTKYLSTGDHPMKPFVHVADGEIIVGDHFPTVRTTSPA